MSQSTVNHPRFRVTMNGQPLLGVETVSVTQANAYQVAKFRLTKSFVPNDAFPVSWFASTTTKTMLVEVELSVDGVSYTQAITGNVDSHRYDPIGNSITIVGRDLAASLMDTRIVTTYRNQTASEIAALFATQWGLKTSITPTKTLVGRYYDTDHDLNRAGDFSDALNQWDLLCRLGAQEGIIPYVFGNTLYFNPPAANPPTYPVALTRNSAGLLVATVTQMQFERHMTVARDVVVTVRSWNSVKKSSYSARVRTKTRDQSRTATAPSYYLFEYPNLTQAQCLAKAQYIALDISKHERNVSLTIPSLALINPQTVIPVSGTGTDYDMTYYPLTVTYDVSFQSAASTTIQARFSSPLGLYDDNTGEQIGEQA